MTKFAITICIAHLLMGNVRAQHYKLGTVSLKTIQNATFNWKPYQNKIKVIAFLGVDCPLSQQATLPLRQVLDRFAGRVSVIGIFPGELSGTAGADFRNKYRIVFPLLSDRNFKLTKLLNATVTPEVFLFNEKNDLLYYGAVDDRAISLSKRKSKAEVNYLASAIQNYLSGNKVKSAPTKAIGCYIEFNQN